MKNKEAKIKKLKIGILILIISFLFSLRGFTIDDEVIKVEVSKNEVETGEVFTYEIKIVGIFSKPQLILPEFKDFKIISQSQSKNYSFSAKKRKMVFNLTYLLFAPQPGIFTIKEVILKDKDKEFKGRSITIEVKGRPLEKKRKILPYIEKGRVI